MIDFLTAFSVAVAGWLLLPVVTDLVSLIRPWRQPRPRPAGTPPSRFLFVVPAHDEALLIGDCLRSIATLRYPRHLFDVVVIADNCRDDTARISRALGAKCLERHDLERRGKPFALAWAFEQLDLAAVDAIIILDADAIVDPHYVAELDQLAPLRGKAVECYDDVRNRADGALTRMAKVFATARFRGAFQLKLRAGMNVPLSDGMCVGTDVLREHPWRAFGLSEDWEVYGQLTAAGVPIELASRAHLYASETRTLRQSSSQRQRWLAGRIGALWRVAPALIRSNRIDWHQKLDAIAELASPGPVTHLGAAVACTVALLATHAPATGFTSALFAASLARPAAYMAVGLWFDPEPLRSAMAFAFLPVYAVWRVGVAAQSLRHLWRAEWIRTDR